MRCLFSNGEGDCHLDVLVENSSFFRHMIEDLGESNEALPLMEIDRETFMDIIDLLDDKIFLEDLSPEELEEIEIFADKYDIPKLMVAALVYDEKVDYEQEEEMRQAYFSGAAIKPNDYLFDMYDNFDLFNKGPMYKHIPGLLDPNKLSQTNIVTLGDFRLVFSGYLSISLNEISNVVVAGGSVVNSLLGDMVPKGDVDIFIYGLDRKEAINKIVEIVNKVREKHNDELYLLRTKRSFTISGIHPPIQIILRLYRDIQEVLVSFDLDCVKVAYDGERVYMSQPAKRSFLNGYNLADGDRQIFRTGTYETRLFKYLGRGFNVRVPRFCVNRVNPKIFQKPPPKHTLAYLISHLFSYMSFGIPLPRINPSESYTSDILFIQDQDRINENLVLEARAGKLIWERITVDSPVFDLDNEIFNRNLWVRNHLMFDVPFDIPVHVEFISSLPEYYKSLTTSEGWYDDTLLDRPCD